LVTDKQVTKDDRRDVKVAKNGVDEADALPLARQCVCGVSERGSERKKGPRWYAGSMSPFMISQRAWVP